MIFVTVGTHYLGFDRLIKKMDEISGKIDEEVVMQIGYTEYEPKNAKWFKFLDMKEIRDLYKKANIIVAHAGAGTLLDSLYFEKPVIIVPRLKKLGEHIDDQQIELSKSLENRMNVFAVYNMKKLEETVKKIESSKFQSVEINQNLILFLKDYLRGRSK